MDRIKLSRDGVQEYLTLYLLQNVWNLPYTEFRQNIRLRPVSNRQVISRTNIDGMNLEMPNRDPYYLYECPVVRPIGIYPRSRSWVSVQEFVNNTGLDIRLHGEYGQCFFRSRSYLIVVNGVMYIAIRYKDYIHIAEDNPVTSVYLSLYKQPDSSDKLQIQSVVINSNRMLSTTYNKFSLADIVLINGRESNITSYQALKIGDLVELIFDPGIIHTTVIKESDNTFIDKNGNEKIIVHLPKIYNVENTLITHNTCDVYVRPKPINDNTDENYHLSRMSGNFLNRTNTDEYIGQITHNDFYIDKRLIDKYKTKYGLSEVELRVVFRHGDKTDKLVRDRNYISLLYRLSDSEILQFLSGNGDPAIPFWTAKVLSESTYSKTLYSLQKPKFEQDLSIYLDAFGYLTCLDLTCAKVQRYMTSYILSKKQVSIPIPLTMMGADSLTCNVIINGERVPMENYTAKKINNELQVTFLSDYLLKDTQCLMFELFETSDVVHAEYFTPSSGNRILEVNEDVDVYKVHNIGGPNAFVKHMISEQDTFDESYELIEEGEYSITYSGANTNVVFSTSTYGNKYLVMSKNLYKSVYSQTFTIDDLDGEPMVSTPLMLTCKTWSGDDITIPALASSFLGYLNNKELSQPIDLTMERLTTSKGYLVGHIAYVSNIDMLNDEDNHLEIMASNEVTKVKLNDFHHEDFEESLFTTLYLFKNINMTTINGFGTDTQRKGIVVDSRLMNLPHGGLVHTRITVPRQLVDIFEKSSGETNISIQEDVSRIKLLTNFFKDRELRSYKLYTIEKSHNIYSIITALIIKDYLNGTLNINPNTDLLPQLTSYTALKDVDVVMGSTLKSITVENHKLQDVNGTYVIDNNTLKGNQRTWTNSSYKIKYDTDRWVITDLSTEVIASSTKIVTEYDPWNLMWSSSYETEHNVYLSTAALDLRYIDAYPSYTSFSLPAEVGYADKYSLLKSVIDAIFPKDIIQDEVAIR